jgi:hypothetical protein
MHLIASAVRGLAIVLPFGLMIAAGPFTAAADPSPNQPPSDPQNVQKLMGLVSKGYGPANCKAIPTEWQGQLAKVECQVNDDPAGPDWAMFVLYGDPNDLKSDFKGAVGNDQTLPCVPGGDSKPHTWNYGQNSTDVAGWVACGTFNGTAEVIWTNNAKDLLGVIEGNDLADLYQWWQTNG